MKKNLHTFCCFVVLFMFWGLLYPQYALTEDMYRIRQEDGVTAEQDPAADYACISAAKPGEVEIHFFWLEKLDEWFGEKNYEDRGNERVVKGTDRCF